MAILTRPKASASRIFDLGDDAELPDKGTFLATCLDVKDVFGVERRKYQSEDMETVDLTAFLFGYRNKAGEQQKIATRAMKISGNEKATLYIFLRSWLGTSPEYGWDYSEMKGKKALITVDHDISKDGNREYANIVGISPVPDGMTEAPAKAQTPKQAAQKAADAAKAKKVLDEDDDGIPF